MTPTTKETTMERSMEGTRGYRLATGAALATGLLLVWVIGAVGLVGVEGDPFDMIYGGVLAVALIGGAIARFRPAGTARAMYAAAAAQALVAVIALIAGKHHVEVSSVAEIVGSNGFFVALWLGSAWLFRRAAGRTGLPRPTRVGLVVGLAPLAATWAACTETVTGPATDWAVAVINPTAGNSISGIVNFTVVDGGVRVVAEVVGLSEGEHGFHIHEFGDCSGPDGKTAGGHFNPTGSDHGGPDSAVRHVGDLGNITANAAGRATMDRVDAVVTLEGDHSVLGRSVIVHADRDDFTTQPTGNAGARLGCGVIGVGKSGG